MIWIVILLGIFSTYLVVRLFLLKKSMKELVLSFRESRHNFDAEQHISIASADQQLEQLALELNQYISDHFQKESQYKTEIRLIRNEITNLSHDLRTPLTSILGYLKLLAQESENLTEEQQEYLQVVLSRSNALNDLVNQLYEYARLQNHEYPIACKQTDLYRTVRERMLDYYQEFTDQEIEVLMYPQEQQLPVWVSADEKCLNRILVNLISNSIKYCGGYLCVSLHEESREVILTFQSRRGNLTDLDVRHLFDRFYRKDQNRTNVMGSGLGLTITKMLMEKMNSRVEAKADEDYLYLNCYFENISQQS